MSGAEEWLASGLAILIMAAAARYISGCVDL